MLYYINLIFFYSLLGFILESVVYKHYKVNAHSSIFAGPYTLVYGFGIFFCLLFYNQLSLILKPNFISYFIYYLGFALLTTLTELIGGHVIHFFLKIDKWDYSNHKFHFGKYICLCNSFIWGLLAITTIFYLHPFFTHFIIENIPPHATYIILLVFTLDLLTLILKNLKIKVLVLKQIFSLFLILISLRTK